MTSMKRLRLPGEQETHTRMVYLALLGLALIVFGATLEILAYCPPGAVDPGSICSPRGQSVISMVKAIAVGFGSAGLGAGIAQWATGSRLGDLTAEIERVLATTVALPALYSTRDATQRIRDRGRFWVYHATQLRREGEDLKVWRVGTLDFSRQPAVDRLLAEITYRGFDGKLDRHYKVEAFVRDQALVMVHKTDGGAEPAAVSIFQTGAAGHSAACSGLLCHTTFLDRMATSMAVLAHSPVLGLREPQNVEDPKAIKALELEWESRLPGTLFFGTSLMESPPVHDPQT